jgi:septal ring factor EnvC (AmiA/AmiB activator)
MSKLAQSRVRGKKGSKMVKKMLSCFLFLTTSFVLPVSAHAYDATTDANLRRSRDALLDQEAHLKDSANRVSNQIQQLQQQLGTINDYLRDTDNAIRDVEQALRNE